MTHNESTFDRETRILVSLAFALGIWATWPDNVAALSGPGLVQLFFLFVCLEVLATGLVGWSPMYVLLGLSSLEKTGRHRPHGGAHGPGKARVTGHGPVT